MRPETQAGLTNWAGNVRFAASTLHRPASLQEAQKIVARASNIRGVGGRHSFSTIADARELISLADLPPDVVVDRAAATVSFSAGMTYGGLATALEAHGVALHNLASLLHISVAGAIATATHGSGPRNGGLATSVAGLELIDSSGDLVHISRGDADFEGAVVGLGALGVVARITLDVEPTYQVRQRVFENMDWRILFDHFEQIMSAGYSVSIFTRWGQRVDQVWVKSLASDDGVDDGFFDATPADVERHPLAGMDPANCTPQLGVAGPWWDRLPHFRLGFLPSSGEELQSEYFVPREYGLLAIDAIRSLAEKIRPVLQVSEIRTVAADRLWMSPEYGRDSLALHFTWQPRAADVQPVLLEIESALRPFRARPHWGKVFCIEPAEIAELYERLPNFVRLIERLDPRGKFHNAWLLEHLGL